MMKLLNLTKINSQFLRFVGAGGGAALANFFSRIYFSHFMAYTLAIIFAYFIGMTTAYLLFKLAVFQPSKNSTFKEMLWFSLINLVALVQVVIVSLLFANVILVFLPNQSEREALAHFIGIGSTIFTSYLAHKYFTFRTN